VVVEVSGRAWMIRQTTKQEKVVENIGVDNLRGSSFSSLSLF